MNYIKEMSVFDIISPIDKVTSAFCSAIQDKIDMKTKPQGSRRRAPRVY